MDDMAEGMEKERALGYDVQRCNIREEWRDITLFTILREDWKRARTR